MFAVGGEAQRSTRVRRVVEWQRPRWDRIEPILWKRHARLADGCQRARALIEAIRTHTRVELIAREEHAAISREAIVLGAAPVRLVARRRSVRVQHAIWRSGREGWANWQRVDCEIVGAEIAEDEPLAARVKGEAVWVAAVLGETVAKRPWLGVLRPRRVKRSPRSEILTPERDVGL